MEKKQINWGKVGKITLIVIVLALVVLAVRRIFFVKSEVDKTPLSTVSVGHAGRDTIEIETSLVGTVLPGDVYYVVPKLAGEITKIYVKTGDSVKAGDKICEIDNEKQIESARLTLEQAKIQLDSAETNLERMKTLYESGDISKQSYEQIEMSYEQASMQVDAAKLQYDTYVEYSTVTSPVDGVVESVNMTLKGLASQQSQVAVITAEGDGYIQFNVTDRLLAAINVGDKIRIEKQGEEYEGLVTSKDTMPGSTTGLYLVKAKLGENSIPAGSSVKVYFVSERAEDALLVPTDCIYYDGGLNYVYTAGKPESTDAVAADGNSVAVVHRIQIEKGISDGEFTEIISGIDETDDLILTWTSQLYEGAKVQVLGGLN